MTAIKRHVVLFNDSAATNGDWVRLDTRYDQNSERSIQGAITTGDILTLQGTTLDAKDTTTLSTLITADDISTLKMYEENFSDVLVGNWTFIRIVKTGTTANAKIQGYV